jgi:hypothetical protein
LTLVKVAENMACRIGVNKHDLATVNQLGFATDQYDSAGHSSMSRIDRKALQKFIESLLFM